MVYKDAQLVWTAKTATAPLYVNTAKFGNQQGLLVTLSDNGWLQVAYLGTDSPTPNAAALNIAEGRNLNYEQMDMQHQRLLARIRNHEDEKQVEPEDKLVITPVLSSFVEATQEYIDDPKQELARNERD